MGGVVVSGKRQDLSWVWIVLSIVAVVLVIGFIVMSLFSPGTTIWGPVSIH
jgi:uncharacterized membrane protein